MVVKFKKLHPNAVLPVYAKPGDAAMDLTAVSAEACEFPSCTEEETLMPGYFKYKFGLSIEIPKGFVGLIFPRSSISNTCMSLANAVGVIDSGYRGELQAHFRMNFDVSQPMYYSGDRIAQLMIIPYPTIESEWADELSVTERGIEGFGSTNKEK